MSRGMQRSKPAADAGQWDTGAGQWLPEPAPAAEAAAPAPTEARPGRKTTVRQTVDLPRDTHRRLHYRAGAIADNMQVSFKQINAQTIIKELVSRYLEDEELQKTVDAAVRKPFS